MPWAAIASAVAPTIIGGLMGSEGSSQSQTQQNTIDPRMAKYIYGENGTSGLLGEASKWYENNKTGLNPQMLQGLNNQWNVLSAPPTMGTYQQMANLGSGLMSAPVAGNPFTDGRASLMTAKPQNLGMGQPQMPQSAPQRYSPQSYTNPAQSAPQVQMQASPFTMPVAAPPQAQAPSQESTLTPELQKWIEEQYRKNQEAAAMSARY